VKKIDPPLEPLSRSTLLRRETSWIFRMDAPVSAARAANLARRLCPLVSAGSSPD
jgi:hypothetical protein